MPGTAQPRVAPARSTTLLHAMQLQVAAGKFLASRLNDQIIIGYRVDHSAHSLVGDTQVARHSPQPLPLRPNGDLRPARPRDAWPFGHHRIAPDTGTMSRPYESLGIQEWDERQFHHVYLA